MRIRICAFVYKHIRTYLGWCGGLMTSLQHNAWGPDPTDALSVSPVADVAATGGMFARRAPGALLLY